MLLRLLFEAASKLAQAHIPNCIARNIGLSKITTLEKSNGHILGVVAGHYLCRLVSKPLVRIK